MRIGVTKGALGPVILELAPVHVLVAARAFRRCILISARDHAIHQFRLDVTLVARRSCVSTLQGVPRETIVIKCVESERVRAVTRLTVVLGDLFRELFTVRVLVAGPTLVRGPHERPHPCLIFQMARRAGDRLVGTGKLILGEMLLAPKRDRTEAVLLVTGQATSVFTIELPRMRVRVAALARLLAALVARV